MPVSCFSDFLYITAVSLCLHAMAVRISRIVLRLTTRSGVSAGKKLKQSTANFSSSLVHTQQVQTLQRFFFSTLYNPAFRQPVALLSTATPKNKAKTVSVTFTDRDGDEHTVQAKVGDSLLEVAKEYDIDLEGACEGTLSCSTCHLVIDPEWYDKIPDPLTEEEQDMLDLAYGLTDTSRLGCQILVTEDLEGIKLTVPSSTRDARDTL